MKNLSIVFVGLFIITFMPLRTYAQQAPAKNPQIVLQGQIKDGVGKINKLRAMMKVEMDKLKELGKEFKEQVDSNKKLYAQLDILIKNSHKSIPPPTPVSKAVPVAPIKS